MRLLSWNSRTTWRGWQGRAWARPHTHAGCMVSRCCTPRTSSPPGLIQSCFPPCRSCPASSMSAHVAQLMLVGSSSRGLACGIAGELCCLMMWPLRTLGSTSTSTRTPWISCWFRPIRISRWPTMWCPRTSMDCSSGVQRVMLDSWAWESCSNNCGPGSDVWARMSSCRSFLSRVTSPGPRGGDPGRPGGERAPGLALCGWLESQEARVLQLSTACTECGDPTRRVCWTCCVGLCSDCYTWRQPCTVCGRAADSLMMIAAQRARQWRENEGLLDDNDFAYAYTDYDQVVGLAGHHVADDWLQTRARVEEELLAAGAKVVEDNPKGSVTLRPVRKTIYKKKPKSVNVDKNLNEAVQKRVNGLVSMFVGLGTYKPAGILTDNLKAEWKQTCRRIAEKKVKDAEKATIDRVVNTWLELRSFLESRGRPAPPGMVDLDQFLNHTSAPARALQALKCMYHL